MWTELVENPKALAEFENGPALDSVFVMKMELNRDGPTVTLSIGIIDYPKNPPARWLLAEANAVTIDLQAVGVTNFQCSGWATENATSLSITREATGKIHMNCTQGSLALESNSTT
jgi:hypothetical protein